jgi:16S rRNA (guanine966-N2)-methyltransferase
VLLQEKLNTKHEIRNTKQFQNIKRKCAIFLFRLLSFDILVCFGFRYSNFGFVWVTMRIISGTSKGRKLVTPRGQCLRPTSDRVKESIFNILRETIEGKRVLDLFAGTGNLGIEALSRGARKVVFVERGRHALGLIQKNLEQFGLVERSEILPIDANRAIGILKQRGRTFDVIFMDPPYEKGLIEKTLLKLSARPVYHRDSLLVIEHHRREVLPPLFRGWNLIRQRQMGETVISFLTPQENSVSAEGEIKS